jgi:hypothetical protein
MYNISYFQIVGIDAKLVKFTQFLNASNPAGAGTLFHNSGAVPTNAFAVDDIL